MVIYIGTYIPINFIFSKQSRVNSAFTVKQKLSDVMNSHSLQTTNERVVGQTTARVV